MQRILLFPFLLSLLGSVFSPSVFGQSACPGLAAYYPDESTGEVVDWPQLNEQLVQLLPLCLESAEFFALYGAAQLNSDEVAEASESLELALLLDAENGSAQIDYAQALFLQGQLFSALELNQQILDRGDVPPQLLAAIEARHRSWRGLTRENSVVLDVLAGYDNNLNGAPDAGQVTLTLSNELILLGLDKEFQPNAGPYLNFRLADRYRQLAPQHQHNFTSELRGRVSEDADSDFLQFDNRYAFIKPGRRHSWQLSGGISHLVFGGDSLYTATDLAARYQRASRLACKPYYGLSLQHQLFHGQSNLNAVEGKASAGFNCPVAGSPRAQQFSAQASLFSNSAVKSRRPGGDRNGWQIDLSYRIDWAGGELRSQIHHTKLNDKKGFSPLLDNGSQRGLSRSYLLLQYRRSLTLDTTLMVNVYRQQQKSNLELFRSTDNNVEIGLSLAF